MLPDSPKSKSNLGKGLQGLEVLCMKPAVIPWPPWSCLGWEGVWFRWGGGSLPGLGVEVTAGGMDWIRWQLLAVDLPHRKQR